MARGKRSLERTADERERAREERARRRAERAGDALPELASAELAAHEDPSAVGPAGPEAPDAGGAVREPWPVDPEEPTPELAPADPQQPMDAVDAPLDSEAPGAGPPDAGAPDSGEMPRDAEASSPSAPPGETDVGALTEPPPLLRAPDGPASEVDDPHEPETAELQALAGAEPESAPPAEPPPGPSASEPGLPPEGSHGVSPPPHGLEPRDPAPPPASDLTEEHPPDPALTPEGTVLTDPADAVEPGALDSPEASADPAGALDSPEASARPARGWPQHTRLPPPVPPFAPGGPGTRATRALAAPRAWRARALAVVGLALVAAVVVLIVHSLSGSSKTTPAPAVPAAVRVLVPEGETRLQIEQIAARKGLKGSYRTASQRSPLLDPASFGAPRGTPDLEGFLFPATYELDPGAPAAKLVQEQLVAFRENFGPADLARARALHVTPYQLLTIASMIEREAQLPGDRAKIAAVIYNRLHAGMPLGIDATIYYAIELRTGVATYTRELTESELHLQSAYNTRVHTGLPPTPISNPGAASISAAAHPAHASYLYYVLAPDGCGEHVFSTSLSAFEANATAYQAALRKNGGKPPACKKK